MNRNEFIAELRDKLFLLSPDEREDAVQFYEEYFDDAGTENEQAVISELGTPASVAEKIVSGQGMVIPRGWRTAQAANEKKAAETGTQGAQDAGYKKTAAETEKDFFAGTFSKHYGNEPHAPGYTPPHHETADAQTEEPPYRRDHAYGGTPRRHHSGWFWALILLTSPIWLTVLACVFVALVTIVSVVFAFLLVVIVLAVALPLAAIVCVAVALYLLPRDLLNGLFVLSLGIIGLGGTLILLPLAVVMIRKGFPALGRGCAACWRAICRGVGRIFGKRPQAEREGRNT